MSEPKFEPMSPFHRRVARPLIRAFLRVLMALLGPLRVRGAYRVPDTGGLLILSNHIADCDPPTIQAGCRRPIRFMAKADLWDIKWLGPALTWGHAFPVKRGEPDRGALRLAAALLKAGECVCVFPEGQLSEDGALQELKPGVALVIRMAGVPVVCCGLRGTDRVVPYGSLVPRPAFSTLELNWGEPRLFGGEATTEEIMGWARGQLLELSGQ